MTDPTDRDRARDVLRRVLERQASSKQMSQPGTEAEPVKEMDADRFDDAETDFGDSGFSEDGSHRLDSQKENHTHDQFSSSDTPHRTAAALASTMGTRQKVRGGELEKEARQALARIQSLSSDREEISEVEYRDIRLERVVLVGLWDRDYQEAVNSLEELSALAKTAGSYVVEGVLQRRSTPSAATYVGRGKAREIAGIVREGNADTVIVDDELSPSQRRGLEDVVDAKVVDRTALILDIFAQHATSREGKAQVELAQLRYLMPRLRGWGESMSRQAGGRVSGGAGIGSRGPGETKIELDRRRISQRMAKLRRDIAAMKNTRDMKRGRRHANKIPSVVIVGYTNAGKSSLMNRLTDADVLVDDMLFATLDPTVRQSQTDDGREYTLADTVGFVSRLPHELIEAFRSTLEETELADVIVHVVDAAHPNPAAQVDAVREVLRDLDGVDAIPEILVFNKADLATPARLAMLRSMFDDAIIASAYTGEGITQLRTRIGQLLPQPTVPIDVTIGYDQGGLLSQLHEDGIVDEVEYDQEGIHIQGMAQPGLAHRFKQAAAENESP